MRLEDKVRELADVISAGLHGVVLVLAGDALASFWESDILQLIASIMAVGGMLLVTHAFAKLGRIKREVEESGGDH